MHFRELRAELSRLGLSTKGTKVELSERLDLFLNGDGSVASKRERQSALGAAGQSKRARTQSKATVKAVEATFAAYKDAPVDDAQGGDQIGFEGMERLCKDLGVAPEDPVMVALSFVMKAENLGVFTRDEFLQGMQLLGVVSVADLRDHKVAALREMLNPASPEFLELYKFAYGWACEPNQKSISKEVAVSLWPLLLRPLNPAHFDDFCSFVTKSDARGVTRDLWTQTYYFFKQFKSFAEHDSDSGAWPVLLDEWVDSVKERERRGESMDVSDK